MSKRFLLGTFLLFAFCFLLFAGSAYAQWTPGQAIVPCTTKCTSCQLLQLVRNVVDFLMIGAAPVLATAFFVWAGVYMILGGANPGMLSKGKDMFKNTFIGLLIVMLAWLITNTVIQTLAKPNVIGSGGSWWTITCEQLGL
ncbi:MAG: pilin [Candidatus Taylorbacteria bacterium]|nr:pilin [Candidatus Taylorbacteria bacterium]